MLRVLEDPNGTARSIRSEHYRIAGKTGTAKMSFGKEGYTDKNLSSFVGFFPADAPQYSCIVVVGGPQGFLTTGGAVSAPVFRAMADKIITSNIRSNVAINKDSLMTNKPVPFAAGNTETIKEINKRFHIRFDFQQNWDYAFMRGDTMKHIGIGKINVQENTVPDVRGMLIDDAIYLLENRGLKVVFAGKGKVAGQSIAPGTNAVRGSMVNLVLR
jgi:cell division protein FtsI (penicillin-binding protein 3)